MTEQEPLHSWQSGPTTTTANDAAEKPFNPIVSIFRNNNATTGGRTVSLSDLAAMIRNPTPKWSDVFCELRGGVTKERKAAIKDALPAFTGAGVFTTRDDHGLVSASGLVQQDVDGVAIGDSRSIIRELANHDEIAMAFLSPSGGIKMLVRADYSDAKSYRRAWTASRVWLESEVLPPGVTVDPSTKNLSRLCYLSWDPDAHIKDYAEPLDVDAWTPANYADANAFAPAGVATTLATGATPYGAAALEKSCDAIRNAPNGSKHRVLFANSAAIGELIGGGEISADAARFAIKSALESRASEIADMPAAVKTMESAIARGMNRPRNAPQRRDPLEGVAADGLGWIATMDSATQSTVATEAEMLAAGVRAANAGPWEPNRGAILHDLDTLLSMDTSDLTTTLLGARWLERQMAALVVAQSGVGKSVLSAQMAVTFAIGRDLFGLAPRHPLRVLLVQAENSEADIADFMQGAFSDLDDEAIAVAKSNLTIATQRTQTGDKFVGWLSAAVEDRKPDLVILDPLFGFLGCDASDQAAMSEFLRVGLSALLQRHNCGVVIFHHTPKPPREATSGTYNNDYIGYGSSDLTNWVRAIAFLGAVVEGKGKDARPMLDDDGNPIMVLAHGKRSNRLGAGCPKKVWLARARNGLPGWRVADTQPMHSDASAKPQKTAAEIARETASSRLTAGKSYKAKQVYQVLAAAMECSEKTAVNAWKAHVKGWMAYDKETETYSLPEGCGACAPQAVQPEEDTADVGVVGAEWLLQ